MVTVLEDVAFRVDGLRFLEQVPPSCEEVVLDLSACSVHEGMWALPALDAVAAHMPAARLGVLAGDDLSALLVAHLRAQRHQVVRVAGGTSFGARAGALVVELSPHRTMRPRLARLPDGRTRLRVPSRPFPKRTQHAWGHWVDGARACGFDARAARPTLHLRDREAARSARLWLRERFGRRGRTLVALLPSASRASSWGVERFAQVGRELETRLGATLLCRAAHVPGAIPLDELDIVTAAHVLTVVAVAVGDAGSLVHVAAAAGAAAVSLHGEAPPEEYGAASELGAAISAERCRCPEPRPGCLACIAPERVALVAERLAGRRWPWDRLAQVGIVRPLPRLPE